MNRVWARILVWLAALTLVMTGLFWISLPPLDYARFINRSTVVEARNGERLHVHLSPDERYRILTTPDDVSSGYIAALLSIEDQYFYWHPGVNPFALLRAVGQLFLTGKVVSGGSTITMQVARLLEPKPRNLTSKLIEILRAFELEWRHSKDEILTMYLTMVPMGGNIEGVHAGTWWIWGASPQYLSLSQIASLLAIPQAPTARDPFQANEAFLLTRKRIAQRLVDQGMFPPSDMDEIAMFNASDPHPFPKHAWHLSQRLKRGSDRERTRLDARIQQEIETLLERFSRKLPPTLNAAAMIADARNGDVIAHVGSLGIDSKNGYIDFTRSQRSPGSTLKPFVYGLAMDARLITDQSILFDVPTTFGGYRPENFDRSVSGPVRVGEALQNSLNIPAVSVIDMLGPSTFMEAWIDAGLQLSLVEQEKPILGIVLGAATTTLDTLVAAYTAIAVDGRVRRLVTQGDAEETDARFLLTEATADTLQGILANVRTDRITIGSGALHPPMTSFKTGTSVGFRDSWTLGAKGQFVIGVWIGTPTGAADPLNTGTNHALPAAEAIADLLSTPRDAPSPWNPEPINYEDIPYQAPEIVYPDNGSELHVSATPAPDRQLPLLITGNVAGISTYLNGHEVPTSNGTQIPVPDDGFYELELRKGVLTIQTSSFAVFGQSKK